MAVEIEPYITVPAFKEFLGKTAPGDTAYDDVLLDCTTIATKMVIGYTRRYHAPMSGTLIFDAPFGTLLPVPDLREIESFKLYDTEGFSDFDGLPYDGPPFTTLRRVYLGMAISWRDDYNLPSYRSIEIAGTWGKTEEPPDNVRQATEVFASRIWSNRQTKHLRRAGGGQLGGITVPPEMVTVEINDLLGGEVLVLPEII